MSKSEIKVIVSFGAIGTLFAIIAFLVKSSIAKWIWGALALLVIGFTLIMLIDSIIKRKRGPADILKIVENAMIETIDKPDFMEKMLAEAGKRDVLFKGQRPDSPDYGYTQTNPIMTSTISYSDDYLSKLKTLDGRPLTWVRCGSYCMTSLYGVEAVMVDEYQLYLDDREYQKIYICPYGHSSTYVPRGLKLASDSEKAVAQTPVGGLEQSEKTIASTPCSSPRKAKIYFCANCGSKLPDGNIKFCPECGWKLPQ